MKKLLVGVGLVLSLSSLFFILTHFTLFHRVVVGGTEYSPGANGRVFVQILKNGFQPINNAVCKATIYYPDNTYFTFNSLMLSLGKDGLYYLDFIAPDYEGVYMLSITCEYPNNLTNYYASDVYVKNGETINRLYETYLQDNSYYTIFPNWNGIIEAIFNFTDVDNSTGELNIVYIGHMRRYEDDVINVYGYNFCNDSWVILPNKIDYFHPIVSNTLNNNVSCYISDGTVSIRLYGEALNPLQRLDIDVLRLDGYTPTSQYITELRGGGEIHIETKKFTAVPSNETPSISIIS